MLNSSVIKGFVATVLSSKFDSATETPAFHEEAWALCCSNKARIAIAAPRGHAKTTGITVSYGLATLLFRERRFMLLVSDTEAQAMMFLGLFKAHLQENQQLIELFGIKRDANGVVKFQKDSATDIIVEFEDGKTFRIIAKGAEQSLRGVIWDGLRPDIILGDDMENDELVMNKERREKMRRWFYSALLPCMSSKGIVRIVGTILHMDSLLERLMPKPHAKWSFQKGLKLWSEQAVAGGWWSVKYKAHNEDFTEFLWESKALQSAKEFGLDGAKGYFNMLRQGYVEQGMPDAYSQEYLNIPLDEAVAYFKRHDFLEATEEHRNLNLNYYITADLAISESERADYSVFMVAGVDERKRLYIVDVLRMRADARELVDTFINLQRAYNPIMVGIEEMQVSKSIGPFLREEMIKTGVYLNVFPLKHGGKDKIMRTRSMQARVRAHSVYFDKEADWYQTFEDECTRFPRDVHDDQVDCFAYLGLMLDSLVEAPTNEEMEEEEYADELRSSGFNNTGRSRTTGY